MKSFLKPLIWLSIFSIAMGFMESAVVVYLREIFYPEGFAFPVKLMEPHIAITEILREAATVIMLIVIGYITAKTFSERFAWFIYCFAIWDIFYYVFLKVVLNWPESLLTWDILFLLPYMWAGPVIAPILISLCMILLALIIIYFSSKGKNTCIFKTEWLLFSVGSVIIIISFVEDYASYMFKYLTLNEFFFYSSIQKYVRVSVQYIPESFNWIIFMAGFIVIFTGIFFYYKRLNNKTGKKLFSIN